MSQLNTTIMGRLKAATDDLHQAAETGGLQKSLIKGVLPRETYCAFLGQMMLVHGTLETAIDDAMDGHQAFGAVVRDYHRREADIRTDFEFFGGAGEVIEPGRATRRFQQLIERLAGESPVALLGILYVLEGSTNGAKFIAKALMGAWGLQPGPGLASLDPHGDEQRPRWQAFKDAMNSVAFTEDEQVELVDAAKATFQAVMDISDELYEPALV